MMNEPRLLRQVEQHPYPLLFVTISGAHLYGFPSPDSDYDLRGVHLLPLEQVVGLKAGQETVEKSGIHDGLEIDLVTHDAHKFFGLLLKKNGYVLEQVLSPLIVHTTPEHAELKEIEGALEDTESDALIDRQDAIQERLEEVERQLAGVVERQRSWDQRGEEA